MTTMVLIPGMSAAEIITVGVELELVSPERFFAPEIGGMNIVPYSRLIAESETRVTINTTLVSVRRDGNQLVATLSSPYAPDKRIERRVAQVVAEHATEPNADLYFALKPLARNLGAVDYAAMMAGRMALDPAANPDGRFDLVRIGDAVASRNIHAAIYDALRIVCPDLIYSAAWRRAPAIRVRPARRAAGLTGLLSIIEAVAASACARTSGVRSAVKASRRPGDHRRRATSGQPRCRCRHPGDSRR